MIPPTILHDQQLHAAIKHVSHVFHMLHAFVRVFYTQLLLAALLIFWSDLRRLFYSHLQYTEVVKGELMR